MYSPKKILTVAVCFAVAATITGVADIFTSKLRLLIININIIGIVRTI